MSTTIHTQAPAQATAPALRGSLPKTADAPGSPFGDTLAQTIDSAARQAEPAARTGSQYLHAKTADHDTRHGGKPDTATFMKATGADFSTASSLLYGVIGSNTDYRDWNAIMASSDPVQSARQATGALYDSDLPYTSGNGFKPSATQTVAASGNFAWLKADQREGLWIMNNQGEALRQLPASAPDILRAARDFGLNTADLATLADQMDTRGAAHPSVDLRSLAQGGMGTAHDWTTDALAHLKGPGAQDALAVNVQLALELGLKTGVAPGARTAAPPVASAASGPATPASQDAAPALPAATAAVGASSLEDLSKQLTDTLLAQLQNALKSWQTHKGQS
jgi:hypothetical protein